MHRTVDLLVQQAISDIHLATRHTMHCEHFIQKRCSSCHHCMTDYADQVERKDQQLKIQFSSWDHLDTNKENDNESSSITWLKPVASADSAFRNKAKMVVSGAAHQPILGLPATQGKEALSLVDCPLYPKPMQEILTYLQDWIRRAGIPPYNVAKKKGELKFLLLTQAQKPEQYMLRFVLRSTQALPRIENNLAELQARFPNIQVISANIQPVHMARLEGDEEIFLTEKQSITETFNDVPLVIRPKSFFQTNPQVAEQLYATAREWVREIKPNHMWDLFCGVGGFALHCASPDTSVTGIEIEPEAIASAQYSANQMGLTNLSFAALDSAQYSQGQEQAPQVVLVNPPRRGLGKALTDSLEALAPPYIIYSSCNPETMKEDIQGLSHYRLERMKWFDMFPHTDHVEAMGLLVRKS